MAILELLLLTMLSVWAVAICLRTVLRRNTTATLPISPEPERGPKE